MPATLRGDIMRDRSASPPAMPAAAAVPTIAGTFAFWAADPTESPTLPAADPTELPTPLSAPVTPLLELLERALRDLALRGEDRRTADGEPEPDPLRDALLLGDLLPDALLPDALLAEDPLLDVRWLGVRLLVVRLLLEGPLLVVLLAEPRVAAADFWVLRAVLREPEARRLVACAISCPLRSRLRVLRRYAYPGVGCRNRHTLVCKLGCYACPATGSRAPD
jgi:hypothetical protein